MVTAVDLMTESEVVRWRDEPSGFGGLATAAGHLPLKAMQVQARIEGLVAEVTLRQTFVNNLGQPLEATYIFPLPDRAAVTRFRMEVADRVVDGVVKERGQARRDYDAAIQRGQRAAITEEERAGVFTLRVGNLMPGESASIRLTLTSPLPYDDGEATFRFPLVVAPRYIPGRALGGEDVGDGTATDTDQTPDASRITPPVLLPGYPNPVRLSLSVELNSSIPLTSLRSSLHTVRERQEGQRVFLRLEPGERLNRDFILRFGAQADQVRTGLVTAPDPERAGEGTFALTLMPPSHLSRSTAPRDLIFVLDRSGSMEGWKMVAARRAVARMVDTLQSKDRFNVLAFDDRIEVPAEFGPHALMAASDRRRFQAVEFLAKVDARGGTEMEAPLRVAADLLAGSEAGRQKVVVLVTDGQVGNEDYILKSLSPRLAGTRVFTLGIDRAVNQAFLTRLANLGGGMFELVESEDRLDEVMDKMHRRIGQPVLTNLSIHGEGMQVEQLAPQRLPDLFAGAPLVLLGRYRGNGMGAVVVSATDSEGRQYRQMVGGEPAQSQATGALWARARIRELEDRFVIGSGNKGQLEREIVEVSTRYQVLSRFTAFVAVDHEVVNRGGRRQQVVQAVESPEGWGEKQQEQRKMAVGGAPGRPAGGALGRARAMAAPEPAKAREEAEPMEDEDLCGDAGDDLTRSSSDGAVGMEFMAMKIPDHMSLGSVAQPPPPPAMAPAPMRPSAPARVMKKEAAPKAKAAVRHDAKRDAGDSWGLLRGQARSLRQRMQQISQDPADRLEFLRQLRLELQQMVATMRNQGADAGVLAPLVGLLATLDREVVRGAATDLETLWQEAHDELLAFEDSGPVEERQEGFWKRLFK